MSKTSLTKRWLINQLAVASLLAPMMHASAARLMNPPG